MYDVRGSYDDAFYLMGALVALSGLMLFAIPCLQRRQAKQGHHSPDEDIIEQRDIDLGKKAIGSASYLPVAQDAHNHAADC